MGKRKRGRGEKLKDGDTTDERNGGTGRKNLNKAVGGSVGSSLLLEEKASKKRTIIFSVTRGTKA